MNLERLGELKQQQQLTAVSFIESGHSPMVIEVEFSEGREMRRGLLKNDQGEVLTFQNVKDAYEICRKVDIHQAFLVQIETHDETSRSDYADYHRESTPLTF